MPSLDEWLTVARGIHDFYFSPEGLQRFPGDFNIPEVANWLYHWREDDRDLEWIKQAIRDDQGGEWRTKHPGGSAPEPITPSPASPSPEPSPLPIPAPIPDPNPQPVPAPGSVRVIQVTDASDGEFVPRMYSYWSNAWIHGRTAYVFAGHADGQPRFFKVDLSSGSVERLGPLIGFVGTTEGWYWSRDGWIYLLDGARLRRVSPFTNEAPIVFDISETHPGCMLWQSHSSDDGQTHSATVKQIVNDGAYPAIGTVVFRTGKQDYFPAQGELDESQIDGTGTYLIIKEDDNNRVINLSTRNTQIIRDEDGAVGHSDTGPYLLVGEDNIHGALVKWDLNAPLTPGRRVELLSNIWNVGHISIASGICLRTSDTHLSLVSLNGGGEVVLLAHGGDVGGYDFKPKANLDATGRVATYMIHRDGHYDVFLAVLPI